MHIAWCPCEIKTFLREHKLRRRICSAIVHFAIVFCSVYFFVIRCAANYFPSNGLVGHVDAKI